MLCEPMCIEDYFEIDREFKRISITDDDKVKMVSSNLEAKMTIDSTCRSSTMVSPSMMTTNFMSEDCAPLD